MQRAIVSTIFLMYGNLLLAQDDQVIDFSKKVTASEVAKHFFGPSKSLQKKRLAVKVGRIGIHAKSKLNCGRIDVIGSVEAEIKNVEKQLKAMTSQIARMFSNPSALAMAATCYYKPQVCSYIRHSSLLFSENINLAFNACKAVDDFIDDQADKGMKKLQAERIQKCISDRSRNRGITGKMVRDCQKEKGRMRNLLEPFKNRYASGKQEVLRSIVSVVKESKHYDLLAKLLGEVEVHENGYWVKLFPKDLLRPDDFTRNLLAAGHDQTCNISGLEQALRGKGGKVDAFGKLVRNVLPEKLSLDVIKDLKSVPSGDQKLACRALGDGLALIAIKRANAKNKAIMATALANDALPDDLRLFYKERSEMTFAAITAKADSEEIKPLNETLTNLRKLALAYRQKNRDVASGVSSNKIHNSTGQTSCDDELSCER